MKNKLYQALLLIFLVAGISSCDYLDIVPDERPTEEDAFQDKKEVIVSPIMTGNFLRELILRPI